MLDWTRYKYKYLFLYQKNNYGWEHQNCVSDFCRRCSSVGLNSPRPSVYRVTILHMKQSGWVSAPPHGGGQDPAVDLEIAQGIMYSIWEENTLGYASKSWNVFERSGMPCLTCWYPDPVLNKFKTMNNKCKTKHATHWIGCTGSEEKSFRECYANYFELEVSLESFREIITQF